MSSIMSSGVRRTRRTPKPGGDSSLQELHVESQVDSQSSPKSQVDSQSSPSDNEFSFFGFLNRQPHARKAGVQFPVPGTGQPPREATVPSTATATLPSTATCMSLKQINFKRLKFSKQLSSWRHSKHQSHDEDHVVAAWCLTAPFEVTIPWVFGDDDGGATSSITGCFRRTRSLRGSGRLASQFGDRQVLLTSPARKVRQVNIMCESHCVDLVFCQAWSTTTLWLGQVKKFSCRTSQGIPAGILEEGNKIFHPVRTRSSRSLCANRLRLLNCLFVCR